MRYKYKSGETFSYKGWNIKVEEIFGASYKIYFSIDGNSLRNVYMDLAEKSGLLENAETKQLILSEAFSQTFRLSFQVIDTISVIHCFSAWEKCRNDAHNRIDKVLGDVFTYLKKEKLFDKWLAFLSDCKSQEQINKENIFANIFLRSR